ncbi:LD-carboxypeptidase LdcB/DacB [Streptococcus porci]|uniref:LD-carboxypeptidase LdcB/DacB n=1 Tax=Streptococcus porci TaxID=502567 RepID=UPI0004879358|nr:LD-carboxypeptidase LdcB/DacB [Streptococcus porci]
MEMNKKLLSLVLLSSLTLVACSKSEKKAEPSKSAETTQTTQTSQTTQKTEKSESEATIDTSDPETSSGSSSTENVVSTDATFNGSYYSVQGKYGEVIIANKKHPLSASYAPGEDPTALAAFQTLVADMQAQGFNVSNSYSGFRSYETQTGLYNSYVSRDGQAEADRYSARPGYSEHQTGLAFDLLDSNAQLLTEASAASWLASHAHEYGFIVRYLPGKEYSTGYMPEAWHVRYIGKEAKDIYNSGLTLEEYFGVAGGDYEN